MLLANLRSQLGIRLLIGEVMNIELELVTDEQRIRPEGSEVNRLFGDNTRLCRLTGWKPAYGGLEGFRRGLSVTAEWFSQPDNSRTTALEHMQLTYNYFRKTPLESVRVDIYKLCCLA